MFKLGRKKHISMDAKIEKERKHKVKHLSEVSVEREKLWNKYLFNHDWEKYRNYEIFERATNIGKTIRSYHERLARKGIKKNA